MEQQYQVELIGTEKVSLLLPVHNEERNIEQVIRGFYTEIGQKIPFEIIVAEDGSVDRTKTILKELSEDIPLSLIMDDDRKGYMGGINDGLQKVSGEFVLFCDSDGQHFESDFWKMYQKKDDYDIIVGSRVSRADNLFRKIMSKTFTGLAKIMFGLPDLRDITGPFRLVRSSLALNISKDMKYMRESYWTEFTIRAHKSGAKILEIPIRHRERPGGGATQVYTLSKIPKIVYAQLRALFKIWWDLK